MADVFTVKEGDDRLGIALIVALVSRTGFFCYLYIDELYLEFIRKMKSNGK